MRDFRTLKSSVALLVLAALAGGAANNAGASRTASSWKKLLLSPAQAEALQHGVNFHYYDAPIAERKRLRVGSDDFCSRSRGNYNESIEGNLPGATDSPEDLTIAVHYFAPAAAAHQNFRCLSRETYNFKDNGQFDLTSLERHVGNESFGGGGDNNPIGVLRQGRYVIWVEVENGFGPIGQLMQAEAGLVRQYG
jgi:hypothetical protein